ncbi:MAG: propanediol utilization protein [Mogibacterium sp.]|nr:propanediol utilization protein [Mogibacterium sp.]
MKCKEGVKIEVSARHVHLCQADVDRLFGEGYELTKHHDITGAFVANEKLVLIGPKRSIERVSILGPTRKETQVEVSLTDARTLGVEAKIRLSGDLAGTSGIKIKAVDTGNEIEIDHGVIAAKRHLHCGKPDAEELGLKNGDIVKLAIKNDMARALVFDDVEVRVGGPASVVHIDTDEGNACGIGKADVCTVIFEG